MASLNNFFKAVHLWSKVRRTVINKKNPFQILNKPHRNRVKSLEAHPHSLKSINVLKETIQKIEGVEGDGKSFLIKYSMLHLSKKM